jgi:hypothetical protein
MKHETIPRHSSPLIPCVHEMKRKPEPAGTADDQQRALRDHLVMLMTSMLANKEIRKDMSIVPALNFSRLVRANTQRLHWREAEDIFRVTGATPVKMNTEELHAWIDEEAKKPEFTFPVGRVYTELFEYNIQFVPWREFLQNFHKVVDNTIDDLRERRKAHPLTITVLMLEPRAVAKSNAWLTGLVWSQLATLVDFVVGNWNAAASILYLAEMIASGDASNELKDMLKAIRVDVIYIDDMIYSGSQASETAFEQWPVFVPVGERHPHYTFDRLKAYSQQLHVFFVTPYIGTKGTETLTKEAVVANVGSLAFARGMTTVRGYGENVAPYIQNLLKLYWIHDERVKQALSILSAIKLPAIVFEHKLADGASISRYLFEEGYLGIGLPVLATEQMPFYKKDSMRWVLGNNPDSGPVVTFDTIDALFAAMHAHMDANPLCAFCGDPARLKCLGCNVVSYCSPACRATHKMHPIDQHALWCHQVSKFAQ